MPTWKSGLAAGPGAALTGADVGGDPVTWGPRPGKGNPVGSTLVTDEKLQFVLENMAPCTLPAEAYGPQPIVWTPTREPVWAWVSWPHKTAERLPAWATGANDRVVIVAWDTDRGERNTVVWRSAVTRRTG
jgi:hypothetical protein